MPTPLTPVFPQHLPRIPSVRKTHAVEPPCPAKTMSFPLYPPASAGSPEPDTPLRPRFPGETQLWRGELLGAEGGGEEDAHASPGGDRRVPCSRSRSRSRPRPRSSEPSQASCGSATAIGSVAGREWILRSPIIALGDRTAEADCAGDADGVLGSMAAAAAKTLPWGKTVSVASPSTAFGGLGLCEDPAGRATGHCPPPFADPREVDPAVGRTGTVQREIVTRCRWQGRT